MSSIRDYVQFIVAKYGEAKSAKLSRYSLEWGTWSAALNTEIRQRIENNDPQTFYLNHVFQLWVVVSRMIELEHKNIIRRVLESRALNDELGMVIKVLEEGMKNERGECSAAEHLRSGGIYSGAVGEDSGLS